MVAFILQNSSEHEMLSLCEEHSLLTLLPPKNTYSIIMGKQMETIMCCIWRVDVSEGNHNHDSVVLRSPGIWAILSCHHIED